MNTNEIPLVFVTTQEVIGARKEKKKRTNRNKGNVHCCIEDRDIPIRKRRSDAAVRLNLQSKLL